MSGYLYLLQEREFVEKNEDVYKIGKTKQEFGKRMADYPKNSVVHLQILVENVDTIEKILIKNFKEIFKQRLDIGYEYFEGNKNKVIHGIYTISQLDIKEYSELNEKINDFTEQFKKEKQLTLEKLKKKQDEKLKYLEEKQDEKLKFLEEKQDKKLKVFEEKIEFLEKKEKKVEEILKSFEKKEERIQNLKKQEEKIDDNISAFISDSINQTNNPKQTINKRYLLDAFKLWVQEEQGRIMPKADKIYEYMNKKFGLHHKEKGWIGLEFIREEEEVNFKN
jgi:DNA repair exonuclease SbcCD ATPase subunit